MKTLTHKDFETETVNDIPYMSHKAEEYEVCIEPCLNGYDVALYDKDQTLVGEKTCIDEPIVPVALVRALETANEKVAAYTKE